MGIVKVTLETESGERVTTVFDKENRLTKLLPLGKHQDFPLTSRIDLYGNTIFNRVQMNGLLEELALISNTTQDPEAVQLLNVVKSLASRARDEPHLYLKFYGD